TPTPTYFIPPTPGQVSVIDTASGSVLATIGTELYPNAIAVSADGAHAFVSNRRFIAEGPPCSISPPAACDGIVSVVDTASNRVTTGFSTALQPAAVAADPHIGRAYVAHQVPDQQLYRLRAALTIIDVDSFHVTTIVLSGFQPHGVAVNPVTSRAYVTVDN